MAGLSDDLSAYVAEALYDDLPPATVTAAKQVLLDGLGVMLGASGMAPEVLPFVKLAAGDGPCTILGNGLRASAPMAALANGAMAHALDYEDAFDLAPIHPNASLLPALIALAQAEGGVDGRRFLTALAVGCDIGCRLALALRQRMEVGGWYPPPILAGMGAVAGAAHLLGLNAGQVRDAFSLMLCQNVMPGEIKHSQGTVIRAVREAFPAQAAVLSALLVRGGVAGFEQPIEGRHGFYALYAGGAFDESVLREGLGRRFWIEALTFKRWPSCRGTHGAVEMALAMGVKAQDIAQVEVGVDAIQTMLCDPLPRKRAPQTAIDAKFSIPFTLALALVRGRVGLDDFDAASLADPAVLDMAGRITPVLDKAAAWQGAGGWLRVTLRDGQVLEAAQADALGCPARPLGAQALRAKFADCAARAALPPADAPALAAAILSLEQCGDVGALF
ncbi:MmgE/PrpD family protein [Novosphingobium umbonatum]|uniref:MmgE/PrpD family protein n=2 Tax=Novosphingobium umbonatum TaxID=1908524 RepID=A0A3S2YA82_9SPHN|nr:MmgE/PrpD family protein [Novosphingobium umbonatum]